jgi:hypothetical protein
MRHAGSSSSIWPSAFWWLTTAIAIVIGSAISVGHALAMELSASTQEQQPTTVESEPPLDAFGYLGGLSEARFYEPHKATNDPRAEIRQAASLHGVDVAMMMSIAKSKVTSTPGPEPVLTMGYLNLAIMILQNMAMAAFGMRETMREQPLTCF